MKNRALSAAIIIPMLLCQCNSSKPVEQTDDSLDDPMPAAEPASSQQANDNMIPEGVAVQLPMTSEESEDLNKVLAPLCATQEDVSVYYHGIQYKGEKPKTYLLGKVNAAYFQQLATATHSVATGEVTDDFERYTFQSGDSKPVEAYISRSNREYGIELTEATAVYAPAFHDLIVTMRNLWEQALAASVAQQTQH